MAPSKPENADKAVMLKGSAGKFYHANAHLDREINTLTGALFVRLV